MTTRALKAAGLQGAGVAVGAMALQVAAAVYFILDALGESGLADGGGLGALSVVDLLVAAALLAGIAYSALAVQRMRLEAERHQRALTVARGALGELIEERFAAWNLSRGEAEVALFALKGFSPAEIADLRGSATGTVRSQLSAVYAKAEVTGQPMLMALFLEDLLEPQPSGGVAGSE